MADIETNSESKQISRDLASRPSKIAPKPSPSSLETRLIPEGGNSTKEPSPWGAETKAHAEASTADNDKDMTNVEVAEEDNGKASPV